MSPWNYPVLLTLDPLIDAIAAGNTAMVKPSAYAPATAAVLKMILEECFQAEYVAVITGGRAENQALLQQRFDMIFFTGGKTVGREVLRHAAEYLTPVTLELGGKSPCIVDSTAKIRLAAKRIVFGKYLNCGQTCVAPDYILCDKRIRDELITAILAEIEKQFGKEPLKNPNYGKIINEKHFERILGLINGEKLVYGGQSEPESLRIAPTVLNNITWDDAVMGEEIFGPLLPILTFDTLDEALDTVESHPHPLALYFFSEDKAAQKKVLDTCRFGGGCINDTIIHLATSDMPFGGVGESGMGSYHGRVGFETFSHYRSIVDKKTWMDLPIRYQKYTGLKEKMMRMFLK
jgi:aldehyde dehydrogenase (NAD+)